MSEKQINYNKSDIDSDDKDNKVFIHFKTKEECIDFIKKNTSNAIFGHCCCSGKGVHIIKFNNQTITDYGQLKQFKVNC